ncbi:hypothetical protein GQX74_011429 [Glossina fuscipes]|nr:hypothetical protein GQX74_011429 [Glossina fuscipes]
MLFRVSETKTSKTYLVKRGRSEMCCCLDNNSILFLFLMKSNKKKKSVSQSFTLSLTLSFLQLNKALYSTDKSSCYENEAKEDMFNESLLVGKSIRRSKTVVLPGSIRTLGQRDYKSRIIDNKFFYHHDHQHYHHHRHQSNEQKDSKHYDESAGNGTALHEISTKNDEKYHQKPCCYTEKVRWQLNEIFLERLKNIARNGDNKELKLVTYQEWVNILQKFLTLVINNTEKFESELIEHLERTREMNSQRRECLMNDLTKCRRDIHSLIGFVQNAYENDRWDFQHVTFETISWFQILGTNDPNTLLYRKAETKRRRLLDIELAQQRESDVFLHHFDSFFFFFILKRYFNMNILALELAKKYNEIHALKKRIDFMEEHAKNTQKELELKDNMIDKLKKHVKSGGGVILSKSSVHTFLLEILKFFAGKF